MCSGGLRRQTVATRPGPRAGIYRVRAHGRARAGRSPADRTVSGHCGEVGPTIDRVTSSFESHTHAVRLSDAQRDRVLGVLRDGAAQGKLSHDTFMRRMELALTARRPEELAALTADLEGESGFSQRVLRVVGGVSGFPGRIRRVWRNERLPKLLLPAPSPHPLQIGRDPGNGLRLNHETVSRMHAQLIAAPGGGWLLRDLGSTNGTCVNGRRVTGTVPVGAGDQVSFGRMSFCLAAPAPTPPG